MYLFFILSKWTTDGSGYIFKLLNIIIKCNKSTLLVKTISREALTNRTLRRYYDSSILSVMAFVIEVLTCQTLSLAQVTNLSRVSGTIS